MIFKNDNNTENVNLHVIKHQNIINVTRCVIFFSLIISNKILIMNTN